MNLKKRKFLTLKKDDSFMTSLFLSSCFSFQIRPDLVLVKFYYNAAVRRFLKTFRKFEWKRIWWKPFLGTEHKWIPLNDNIVWCKYTRVIKNFSKSGSFFLLNAQKHLGVGPFYSLYTQTLRIFWNVFLSKKTRET